MEHSHWIAKRIEAERIRIREIISDMSLNEWHETLGALEEACEIAAATSEQRLAACEVLRRHLYPEAEE